MVFSFVDFIKLTEPDRYLETFTREEAVKEESAGSEDDDRNPPKDDRPAGLFSGTRPD